MNNKPTVVTVLGTRPEIIKLSCLIPKLDELFDHKIIHTGQHYSENMNDVFFKDLSLRNPDYNIHVGSGNPGYQVGTMLIRMEEILLKEKPDMVIVQGDTNTTLAGGISASKLKIRLLHIESGARSHNKEMPEELNRIIIDHISNILVCYDDESRKNLLNEGINHKTIFQFSNTSFEVCKHNLQYISKSNKLKELGIKSGREYGLVTIHRAENTQSKEKLQGIISALNVISQKHDLIFPIHPRTKKLINEYNIKLNSTIKIMDALGYHDFLNILNACSFVLSDSGGIQDESVALNKPLFVLRDEMEQRWMLKAGKAILIGTDTKEILKKLDFGLTAINLNNMKKKKVEIDYDVSKKIIKVIKNELGVA
jgi:UDP-N-acetylglucosamine 2-epimerase (non-hydrolysing)